MIVLAVASCVLATSAMGAETTMTLNSMGPLKLGMKRSAALKTDWLSNRGNGCELGGTPYPIDYRTAGASAPKGLKAFVEFTSDRLTSISATAGVRTPVGVRIGTTVTNMVTRYRAAGYGATQAYSDVFGGTFVRVTKRGKQVLGAFALKRKVTTLAIPSVPVCE